MKKIIKNIMQTRAIFSKIFTYLTYEWNCNAGKASSVVIFSNSIIQQQITDWKNAHDIEIIFKPLASTLCGCFPVKRENMFNSALT